MYRARKKPNVEEKVFPANLKELGHFIDKNDQLRPIDKPNEPFEYHFHGKAFNEATVIGRLNERRREAFDECSRQLALERLAKLDIHPICLPEPKTPDDRHVKIMASSDIKEAKRILLLIPNTTYSGLGIWSMREMLDGRIEEGCMEAVCKLALRKSGHDAVAIFSPATLYWDARTRTAMTIFSHRARDRSQYETNAMDTFEAYKIPGHEDADDHIASCFKWLADTICTGARIHILASDFAGFSACQYLSKNFDQWTPYLHAGVLGYSPGRAADFPPGPFRYFMRERMRNYVFDNETEAWKRKLPDMPAGCPLYSAGDVSWSPRVIITCAPAMMQFFKNAWEVYDTGDTEDEWNRINPDGMIPEMKEAMDAQRRKAAEESINNPLHGIPLDKCNLDDLSPGWEVPGMETIIKVAEEARIEREKIEKERREQENARIAARNDEQEVAEAVAELRLNELQSDMMKFKKEQETKEREERRQKKMEQETGTPSDPDPFTTT